MIHKININMKHELYIFKNINNKPIMEIKWDHENLTKIQDQEKKEEKFVKHRWTQWDR